MWRWRGSNYNYVNQKGFFSRNCITGRDRIFNNPSFKREIQRVVIYYDQNIWRKNIQNLYLKNWNGFMENMNMNFVMLVLPMLTKI